MTFLVMLHFQIIMNICVLSINFLIYRKTSPSLNYSLSIYILNLFMMIISAVIQNSLKDKTYLSAL